MPDEIEAAMQRYQQRKLAAAVDEKAISGEETMRLAMLGTDLDIEQVIDKKQEMLAVAQKGFEDGIPLAEIVWGMWFDGLIVGVEVEKARPR